MADNATSWLDFAQRSRDEGGLGLEKHQAAGLVGNLVNESGADLNPWGPSGDNGTAWGTAQWRGDRLTGLQDFAKSQGLDHRSMEAQQAYMRHEFDNSENGAYKALQASTTPEEAATAFNTRYERSADRTGGRERSARQFYDGTDGLTAIQTAMKPRSTPMMGFAPEDNPNGALSSAPPMGALSAGGQPITNKWQWLDKLGQTLTDMAPGIAQDPDHAKVLEAVAAGGRKSAVDQGTWSMQMLPNGQMVRMNSKTGVPQLVPGNYGKPEKDKASDAYETATGSAFAAKNQKIADDAVASQNALGNIGTLRSALSNPDVIQGTGGESIAAAKKLGNSVFGMDFKGVADADVAASLINKLTQESRQLNGGMPGSLSDRDLSFLKAANAGLDKSPEANQRILDIYERLHNRNIEMNKERLAYTEGGKKQLDEGFNTQLAAKWAAQNAADNSTFKNEQSAPKPSTMAPSLKTPNGVQWRRN